MQGLNGMATAIFELDWEGDPVWEYINPFFTRDPRFGDNVNFLFRAHRYGPDHPALQGRDLDPARYGNHNRLSAGK